MTAKNYRLRRTVRSKPHWLRAAMADIRPSADRAADDGTGAAVGSRRRGSSAGRTPGQPKPHPVTSAAPASTTRSSKDRLPTILQTAHEGRQAECLLVGRFETSVLAP